MPQTPYAAGLASQWIQKLILARFRVVGWGSQGPWLGVRTHTFGNPPEPHFTMEIDDEAKEWHLVSISDLPVPELLDILESAITKAEAGDTGDDIVYRFHLGMERIRSTWKHMIDSQRSLEDQVRVSGTYRLGTHAVLEFSEQILSEIEEHLPLAPPAVITVDLFVPGPADGPVSNPLAAFMAELIAALCAIATGRPILPPDSVHEAGATESEIAKERRSDPSIPPLQREGVPLDVFSQFGP
jgi:hypothetical protein